MKLSYSLPIRVLHITTATVIGGAERMLQKLITSTDNADFDSRVISLTPRGPVGEELESAGFKVRHLNATGVTGMVVALPALVRELRSFAPNIIQGWMYHGNLAATVAARLARSAASLLWNIRHSLEDLNNEKRLTAAIIRYSAGFSGKVGLVIYNSTSSMKQHQAIGYAKENAMVIPNGFDVRKYRPSEMLRIEVRKQLGVEESVPLVGLIARYHPIKAHFDFLQAAVVCSHALPEARFMMAGKDIDPLNRKLVEKIRELRLDEKIILLGERGDIDRLLPALDVVALSSVSEGFPNILGEAMSCGVPCVTTAVGDCAWIVGDTGRVVPPGQPDLLGRAMVDLLMESQPLKTERGVAARQRIEQLFSLESVVRQYQELYRSQAQTVLPDMIS